MNGPFIHSQKQTMRRTNLPLMQVDDFGVFQLQTASETFFTLHILTQRYQMKIGAEHTRLDATALYRYLYRGLQDLIETKPGMPNKSKNTRIHRLYYHRNTHRLT